MCEKCKASLSPTSSKSDRSLELRTTSYNTKRCASDSNFPCNMELEQSSSTCCSKNRHVIPIKIDNQYECCCQVQTTCTSELNEEQLESVNQCHKNTSNNNGRYIDLNTVNLCPNCFDADPMAPENHWNDTNAQTSNNSPRLNIPRDVHWNQMLYNNNDKNAQTSSNSPPVNIQQDASWNHMQYNDASAFAQNGRTCEDSTPPPPPHYVPCYSQQNDVQSYSQCCQDPLLPFDRRVNPNCYFQSDRTTYTDSYKCRPVPQPPKAIYLTAPQCCPLMQNCYCGPERCPAGYAPSTADESSPKQPTETQPACYLCQCCNTSNDLHCFSNDLMHIRSNDCCGHYNYCNFQPYFQHYSSGCCMQ